MSVSGIAPQFTGTNGRSRRAPTVSRVMTKRPVVVAIDASLSEAAKAMRDHHVHRVLVVDRERLCGVVTSWDLMRRVADVQVSTPLEALMTPQVITTGPSETVDTALTRLKASHVHGIIVVHDG